MREPIRFEAPLCAQVGGEWWFPDKEDNNITAQIARSICARCPHKVECAEWGIANEDYGVWGGLTRKDREHIRALRRRGGEVA